MTLVPTAACILGAMKVCLADNISEFDGKLYKQSEGTCMGGSFTPPFADIAVKFYDQKIKQWGGKHLVFYGRFRDDGLILWSGY